MSVKSVGRLCELLMMDENFREEFWKDPYKAVEHSGLSISPQELETLLVIGHDDFAAPQNIPEEFIEMPDLDLCDHKKLGPPAPIPPGDL
ncbi:MAG: hypothetical protein RDU20_17835 [Desulfomonilaceae bacterium]|nr:hypothetical protein [Desulfomonilaceae bacterium]